MIYSTDSTRRHPRTTLEAFPDDRAAWACALEKPRPAPLDTDIVVGVVCTLGLAGFALLGLVEWLAGRMCG